MELCWVIHRPFEQISQLAEKLKNMAHLWLITFRTLNYKVSRTENAYHENNAARLLN